MPVPPAEFRPAPIVYDYVRFNQEAFAEFHAWMAGIVHELAPDVPVHAKVMMHAALLRHPAGPWSVAPERFAALSDISGNEAIGKFPAHVVLGCGPRLDEYGRPAHDPLATMPEPKPLMESSDAFAMLRPRFTQAPLRPLATVETEDGRPVWGVEYLSVEHEGRILVNLCNYLREAQRCRIMVNGRPVQGKDLLSGQPWSGTMELPSLRPALVEIVGQPWESRR